MSSHEKHPSNLNRARRHFLGLAAATGAKIAGLGVIASSILPSSKANAWGRNWGRNWGGTGGGTGGGKDSQGACFLAGTSILTSKGEVPIEDIRVGDLVRTVHGGTRPVRWVGRRAYTRTGPTWHPNIAPIRVARHSVDGQTPHRDLYISGGHALYLDGALIEARYLVNDRSIAPTAPDADTVEYFNILLDTHDVIFAEGLPVETFRMVNGNHELFSNFAELEQLMPSASRVAMASFAPRLNCYGGRDHLKALLDIAAHPFKSPRDPIADARERLAARALEASR